MKRDQEQLGLRLDVDELPGVPVVMEPPPFQGHSSTSHEASLRVEPQAATLRAQVLELLRRRPEGLTDEERQAELGMGANTQRPRRVELVRHLWVKDSGRTRLTAGGSPATVWVYVTEEMLAAFARRLEEEAARG